MPVKRGRDWRVTVGATIGFVVLVMVFAAAFLVHPYNIPAASMRPNLLVGDHVLAWRGYYATHAPERGAVAIFLVKDGTVFVKRVIGLPGDTIAVQAGRLWINGAEVDRKEEGAVQGELGTQTLYRETMPDGISYAILENDDSSAFDTFGPFEVPADSYFVMGDNRDNSNDSRVPGFGTIPRQSFLDRPFLIYFSWTYSRIGSRVH